ncbi:MAG: GerMN domain-containing protein [Candidatus Dojkabacteria bacterium]
MFKNKLYIYVLVLLVILFGGYYLLTKNLPKNNVETEKGTSFQLESPLPNTEVSCEFEITGKMPNSWFFEGSFPVSIEVNGKEVFRNVANTEEDWTSEGLKQFYAIVVCKEGCVGNGEIILKKDNPSDLPENDDSFTIPVSFSPACEVPLEKSIVDVYFGSSKEDPDSLNCDTTYKLERSIPKTLGIGRASLELLLVKPISDEKEKGYFTSIPDGVRVNSLRISDGTAYADFNEKLTEGVGGSCLTSRIRSQIENTLKQFDTVKNVVISVNGSTEGVLQP